MRALVPLGIAVLVATGAAACASGRLGDGPAQAGVDAGSGDAGASPIPEPDPIPEPEPDAGPVALSLNQSLSDAIVPQNSAACFSSDANGLPLEMLENSYYRVFDLTALGVLGAVTIDSVTLGIEQATSPAGSQVVTIELHTLSGALAVANLTALTSVDVTVPDQAGTLLEVPIGATVPADSALVLEVRIPDGTGTGNLFFIGSNASGQTGPSFLRAPSAGCDVTEPVDLAALGFGSMHIVLRAAGEH